MRQVSDGYLRLYKETRTIFYLIRSIEQRDVKTLYDEEFLMAFHALVTSPVVHPGWMTSVLNRIKTKSD